MQKKQLSVLVAAALVTMAAGAQAATGPSSSATPYVTPTAAGISVTSVMTVGDTAANGYKMVGIADGLGAYDNGNGTFTVLMNHELGATAGVVRAHGSKGAFVSEWTINKSDFSVVSGKDLATTVKTWNSTTSAWDTGTTAFARLCSADLPAASAFYNSATGKGYNGRIFMNGEESGAEGRAFGFVATGAEAGTAYQLPYLGKFSWENSVANAHTGDKTVVMGTDDSTPGQVYMYVGNKQTTGNAAEQAGLHNGQLLGVKVAGVATETGAINGTFTMEAVTGNTTGAALQTESNADGVTNFARPEDGHWLDADTFVFATTGSTGNTAKIYQLDYTDANDLTLGGTITMLKDSATLIGTDGATARSFDNLTCDASGCIVQEDPGNTSYIAKTWYYNKATGTWTQILESDRARFLTGGAGFLTQDEENSGVIKITDVLGKNDGNDYFLAVTQAHYSIAGELVEGGQLQVIAAPVPEASSYAFMALGMGLVGLLARRKKA